MKVKRNENTQTTKPTKMKLITHECNCCMALFRLERELFIPSLFFAHLFLILRLIMISLHTPYKNKTDCLR